MNMIQPRATPERIYEHNIIHNPKTWMGIWTPHGWRVHKKRWGKARPVVKTLSGDGKTTFFPDALRDPKSGRVEWQDDLHLENDPFTDGGIYPSDPRVEYPAGRQRWAVSHTLLCYPVADHNLFTHEYTWDMTHGHLTTHFRKHVALEEAVTDSKDGMTVAVKNRPISASIEGNVHYPLPNSAVRGVWSDAGKKSENHYVRRVVRNFTMHNAVYGISPQVPVVQCYGMYAVAQGEPLHEVFDRDTGDCTDLGRLAEQFHVYTDHPKLGMFMPNYRMVMSKVYEGEIGIVDELVRPVDEEMLRLVTERLGTKFAYGAVGYARNSKWDGSDLATPGYTANFDFNGNSVIDEEDVDCVRRHLGRKTRSNIYMHAYFGGDWLTTSISLEAEHRPGIPCIADYEYGGGYDSQGGVIRLLNSPGPNKRVWVEYFYDAPAEAGEDNIVVHLYRED